MRTVHVLLLIVSGFSLHCGVTHPVRTLPEGEMQLSGSLGGPLIPFAGTTIPVPYATVSIAKGVSDEVTATAGAHVLMAAFGSVGVDAGVALRVATESGWRPEVVVKGECYVFSDLHELTNLRIFPRVSVTGSYDLGSLHVYGGTDGLLQFSGRETFFISPHLGAQVPLGGTWGLLTELKWMAANIDTRHGIFEGHASLAGHGNIGLFFGVTYGL